MRDPECIFCKIAAGEIPAVVIYESESLLAFLDVAPLAEGHVLVIPRDHCGSITDLTSSLGAEIGWTLNPRGSSACVNRLISLPLPLASQPSNTITTGTPAARAAR